MNAPKGVLRRDDDNHARPPRMREPCRSGDQQHPTAVLILFNSPGPLRNLRVIDGASQRIALRAVFTFPSNGLHDY
jgi:hypothetical protein